MYIVIASGNDASVAMAEHIAGSEGEFVKRMNERAAGLGMENTHFEDCCGLTESENHYTPPTMWRSCQENWSPNTRKFWSIPLCGWIPLPM